MAVARDVVIGATESGMTAETDAVPIALRPKTTSRDWNRARQSALAAAPTGLHARTVDS